MVERWTPTTSTELVEALSDARLSENHHLDFKREIGEGSKANIEMARDMASFANDGGAMVYGVDEPRPGVFLPHPIALDGLRERIDQVARSRCDPPLSVDVRALPTEEDPCQGYLVVRVPISPDAPHSVDLGYFGRSDSTRIRLSDSQIRNTLRTRREALLPIQDLLNADIQRDPIPQGLRRHGHIHLVARPGLTKPDLVLRDVERVGSWDRWFTHELGSMSSPNEGSWWPDLNWASTISPRSRGAAYHYLYMGADRSAATLLTDSEKAEMHESRLIDLEVDEDGTVHVFAGRGTDEQEGVKLIMLNVICGLGLRTVQIAGRISDLTGFVGTWDFAIHVDGLRGATALRRWILSPAPPYSADEFRESTFADTAELARDPSAVAYRLTGRLLRGLDQNGDFDQTLRELVGFER